MMTRWSMLALVWTLFAMPIGAAWSMPDGWKCGTQFPEFGETSSNMLRARPNLDTYIDSESYPIRVHYNYGDEDLMSIVFDAAELSYQMEVEEWGWYPPVSDGEYGGSDAIDYYLTDTDPGIGGYMTIDHWNDCYTISGRAVCPAYMVINREMPDYFISEVVAHEFCHVLQFSTDAVEDHQLMEATSTYTEGPVHSYSTSWGMAVDYQSQWYLPLDYFEYGSGFQYGSFVFLQYLAERFGDGTPAASRELWQESTQSNFSNTRDWIVGLCDWLEQNWPDDLDEPGDGETYVMLAWRDWSEWRFFLGPYADEDHITGGEPATGSARLPFALTFFLNELAAGSVVKELPKEVGELSTVAIELEPVPAGTPIHVQFEDDGANWKWALTLVQLSTDKEIVELLVGPIEVAATELSTTTLEGTHQVIGLLTVLGDGHYHPNLDDWLSPSAFHSGTFTVTAEGIELPEEDPPEEEEPDGCGCRAGGRTAQVPLVGLLLLGLWLARRRR